MTWTIACYCGLDWQGGEGDACPRCGVGVHTAPPPPTVDQWIAHMRSEIGDHTTTSDGLGEAW